MSTVLIVEDNEKNLTLIRDVLEYHGYEVLIARDGAAGVALAKQFPPDVALIDIQMPVMDGLTAARLIRSDPALKGARLIALTSFAMKGDRERFLEAGFDEYIAKPIDTRELPELVGRYASAARSRGPEEQP